MEWKTERQTHYGRRTHWALYFCRAPCLSALYLWSPVLSTHMAIYSSSGKFFFKNQQTFIIIPCHLSLCQLSNDAWLRSLQARATNVPSRSNTATTGPPGQWIAERRTTREFCRFPFLHKFADTDFAEFCRLRREKENTNANTAYQKTKVFQCRSRSRYTTRTWAHEGPQGCQADRHRPFEETPNILPGASCSRTDNGCPGEPEAQGPEAETPGSKTVEPDDGYAMG